MSKPSSWPSWDDAYRDVPPWDTGRPDPELRRFLREAKPGKAVLELGCGTGTNAVFLSQHGFSVEAVDISGKAIGLAQAKAKEAGAGVLFHAADVTKLRLGTFDWIYDRGCYHSLPAEDLPRYLKAVTLHLKPKGLLFLQCFSEKEPEGRSRQSLLPGSGPRRVTPEELREVLGFRFSLLGVREFVWETSVPGFGPKGYAVTMRKR